MSKETPLLLLRPPKAKKNTKQKKGSSAIPSVAPNCCPLPPFYPPFSPFFPSFLNDSQPACGADWCPFFLCFRDTRTAPFFLKRGAKKTQKEESQNRRREAVVVVVEEETHRRVPPLHPQWERGKEGRGRGVIGALHTEQNRSRTPKREEETGRPCLVMLPLKKTTTAVG